MRGSDNLLGYAQPGAQASHSPSVAIARLAMRRSLATTRATRKLPALRIQQRAAPSSVLHSAVIVWLPSTEHLKHAASDRPTIPPPPHR